jgi:hypothetical protein
MSCQEYFKYYTSIPNHLFVQYLSGITCTASFMPGPEDRQGQNLALER